MLFCLLILLNYRIIVYLLIAFGELIKRGDPLQLTLQLEFRMALLHNFYFIGLLLLKLFHFSFVLL